MEILIELTEADLSQIAGGVGRAHFTVTNTASSAISASVKTKLTQATTHTSASQTATVSSVSL